MPAVPELTRGRLDPAGPERQDRAMSTTQSGGAEMITMDEAAVRAGALAGLLRERIADWSLAEGAPVVTGRTATVGLATHDGGTVGAATVRVGPDGGAWYTVRYRLHLLADTDDYQRAQRETLPSLAL